MKTFLFISLLSMATMVSNGQQLSYRSGGNVYDQKGVKLSPSEVRKILSAEATLLKSYNDGRTKKITGNIMLSVGIGAFVGGFAGGYASDGAIGNPATFAGLTLILLAIPVKIGYSRKIADAVNGYNSRFSGTSVFQLDDISVCMDKNGVGLKLAF